jgi:hypothetical protein
MILLQYLIIKPQNKEVEKLLHIQDIDPQVKFDFEEMQTSGQQTFIDKEIVNPRENHKSTD